MWPDFTNNLCPSVRLSVTTLFPISAVKVSSEKSVHSKLLVDETVFDCSAEYDNEGGYILNQEM